MNEIYTDGHMILRFRAKPLSKWVSNHVDLNAMWTAMRSGQFSRAELFQFYQDAGYSLDEVAKLFPEEWNEDDRAE